MKTALILFIFFAPGLAQAADPAVKRINAEELSKGPLKLSADVTISKEHGKIIEASGHVHVKYLMENGDTLQSASRYARYDRVKGLGEIWGEPDALWISNDPAQPATRLLARKIVVNPAESEIQADGQVSVLQSSSTLTAESVTFSNEKKMITAVGGRPEFSIRQKDNDTRISSLKITALTEEREIHFTERVKGTVLLKQSPSAP